MLSRIRKTLEIDCGMTPAGIILVGFSGGPDSTCLLDVLIRLGYPVVAAHLDHGIRPESQADARRVAEMAGQLGVRLEVRRENVPRFAEDHNLSLEEAGRQVRYRFLFAQAAHHGAQAVAVGHTADDQVETVLMHLLRGAGLAGLKGMRPLSSAPGWGTDIPLLRPLLDVWRHEVLTYCRERELKALSDATNLDNTFYRNRLRNDLLPELESYNPKVREVIWRMASLLSGDLEVIEHNLNAVWPRTVLETSSGYVAYDREALLELQAGLQRGLLRRGIAMLRPGARDIDFAAVERALEALRTPPRSGEMDLVVGLRLIFEGERAILAGWEADIPGLDWPQLASRDALELHVPGKHTFPGGWELHAEPVREIQRARSLAVANENPFQAWLDPGEGRSVLYIRRRIPGDRFRPLGMAGHSVKLADFMIDQKLPRRARAGWPLVSAEGEILWVPGFRLAHPARLTEQTKRVVYLRVEKATEGG